MARVSELTRSRRHKTPSTLRQLRQPVVESMQKALLPKRMGVLLQERRSTRKKRKAGTR